MKHLNIEHATCVCLCLARARLDFTGDHSNPAVTLAIFAGPDLCQEVGGALADGKINARGRIQ